MLYVLLNRLPIYLSIYLDETTDVTNFSQLLVCVRYYKNEKIKENFLFCMDLQTLTIAADIFDLIDGFLQKTLD